MVKVSAYLDVMNRMFSGSVEADAAGLQLGLPFGTEFCDP